MANLSEVPTGELLSEVAQRPDDIVDPNNGFLSREAFALQDQMGIRVCVDGAPARMNEQGEVELMAIQRGTGPFAGRLCLVGGGVGRVRTESGLLVPERVDEALTRHFARDLGFNIKPASSWTTPEHIGQDMRPLDGEVRDGFTPNPDSRHLIALRYLVHVVDESGREIHDPQPAFGSTVFGQEATDITWLTEDQMPEDPNAWGYGHDETYRVMFRAANELWLPEEE